MIYEVSTHISDLAKALDLSLRDKASKHGDIYIVPKKTLEHAFKCLEIIQNLSIELRTQEEKDEIETV